MKEELIYLYRRKGYESWATCDADRYSELAGNHFFEVRVARHQHDYAALEAECDRWKYRCQYNANTAHEVAAERDALAAELAAIKGQEPVAIANKGDCAFWVKWTDAGKPLRGPGIKLYTLPDAPEGGG